MVIQARKRYVVALVLTLIVAWFATASAQVYVPSGCKGLTSADWEWWARGCYVYSASEHAGNPRVTRFIVR
jgi:hypothetical protein